MLRFRRAHTRRNAASGDAWAGLAALLDAGDLAVGQTDALLRGLGLRLGVEVVHLYYPSDGGSRFSFAQRAGAVLGSGLPALAASDPLAEQGAHACEMEPPLQDRETIAYEAAGSEVVLHLPAQLIPTDEAPHGLAASRRGARLLCWHVRDGDRTVALLEVGPVDGTRRQRELVAQLAACTPPLAFLLGRLRRDREREAELQALRTSAELRERVLNAMVDPAAFIRLALQVGVAVTRSHGGFVAGGDGPARLLAHHGLPPAFLRGLELDPIAGLFDVDLETGFVLPRDTAFLRDTGTTWILAVPLIEAGALEGIVALTQFGGSLAPSDRALDVLRVLAEQISLLLRSRRVYADFSQRYLACLRALAAALDASGAQGDGHHARVAQVAVAVGRACGFDDEVLTRTRLAAEIHDVGLAAVAVAGGGATERDHPVLGAALLDVLPDAAPIARAVRAQHEWFNGWGFPDGLSGDAIPVEARLLAVAEFAAGLRAAESGTPLAERFFDGVRERSGTHFDPAIAAGALKLNPASLAALTSNTA